MRSVALRILKPVAAAADALRPARSGIVVLAYHRIGGESGLEIDLPEAAFDEQMAEVAERGALTLDDGVERLTGGHVGSGGIRIAVTFDDGTADFVDRAVPILVRHRVPATLYIATAFVEDGRSFPHGGRPVSWAGLRDAMADGFVAVGSHTHTHALLDRLEPSAVDAELERSQGLIEDRLGVPARHFAFPKGVTGNEHADRVVRRRFASASVGGTRVNAFGRSDVYRLARSPVQVSDGRRWFLRKLDGGMSLEDTGRRALNRLRYARAQT